MSDPIEITPVEAQAKLADGAILADVREQDEWDHSHIEGAIHIPLPELQQRAAELPADSEIVFQCRVGGRSLMAAQAFNASGRKATSMAGGLLAWDEQGLPITPPGAGVAAH